jgi:hypothetical protein
MMIKIENNEQEIISTNYWQTEHAMRGLFYLSINAGAFRLLVPDSWIPEAAEWMSAKEVVISRGSWPAQNKSDAMEILFEDDSDKPYAINIVSEQIDRMPLDNDRDRKGNLPRWKFAAWTKTGKILELPCRYRVVKNIPYLKTW